MTATAANPIALARRQHLSAACARSLADLDNDLGTAAARPGPPADAPRTTGRHVPAHRLATQLNAILSPAYLAYVLTPGAVRPHIPA